MSDSEIGVDMRDKNGFLIPCVDERWEIYNDREDKDFICRGDSDCYGWFCEQSEKCPGYKPNMEIAKKRGCVE